MVRVQGVGADPGDMGRIMHASRQAWGRAAVRM